MASSSHVWIAESKSGSSRASTELIPGGRDLFVSVQYVQYDDEVLLQEMKGCQFFVANFLGTVVGMDRSAAYPVFRVGRMLGSRVDGVLDLANKDSSQPDIRRRGNADLPGRISVLEVRLFNADSCGSRDENRVLDLANKDSSQPDIRRRAETRIGILELIWYWPEPVGDVQGVDRQQVCLGLVCGQRPTARTLRRDRRIKARRFPVFNRINYDAETNAVTHMGMRRIHPLLTRNLDLNLLGRNDYDSVRMRLMALSGTPTAVEVREQQRRKQNGRGKPYSRPVAPHLRRCFLDPLTHPMIELDGDDEGAVLKAKTSHHRCTICSQVKSKPVSQVIFIDINSPMLKVHHSYLCGHSHCYACVRRHLGEDSRCPVCLEVMYQPPFRQYAEEQSLAAEYPWWVAPAAGEYSWVGVVFPERPKVEVAVDS
ncbi:hypothetical protein B0H16DRAFT_1446452 [Mycena metata]|uniref:RING-type domain-containing protein n=1 Tax=Mycena metata TaxID=1033252 RepID=A0AAD7KES2_9AGAR|nr:hypothetical protein B0H16DRAFT_1446452 [Mycena metata]